jgi:hypothetical protein
MDDARRESGIVMRRCPATNLRFHRGNGSFLAERSREERPESSERGLLVERTAMGHALAAAERTDDDVAQDGSRNLGPARTVLTVDQCHHVPIAVVFLTHVGGHGRPTTGRNAVVGAPPSPPAASVRRIGTDIALFLTRVTAPVY